MSEPLTENQIRICKLLKITKASYRSRCQKGVQVGFTPWLSNEWLEKRWRLGVQFNVDEDLVRVRARIAGETYLVALYAHRDMVGVVDKLFPLVEEGTSICYLAPKMTRWPTRFGLAGFWRGRYFMRRFYRQPEPDLVQRHER